MGERIPLKTGSIIKMPNGGKYVICEKIGEGGLSLLYTAKTYGNGFPVIIKEFFPSEGASRATSSKAEIGKKKGHVYPDFGYEKSFTHCLEAFVKEGELGSSAHINSYQIIAFADCGDGYAVLPRWSKDTVSFSDLVRCWRKDPPQKIDPVFTDLGRIRFSLYAISSLLSVVSVIHNQGMLHLDISGSNVVWAGDDRSTGKNGAAFLTDFGCSVLMSEGSYPASYTLSYSKEYAAPEFEQKDGQLKPATDLYAVGCLLSLLCFGDRAFGHSEIQDLVGWLSVPPRIKVFLENIINNATALNIDERYQSAQKMQEDIQALSELIPLYPINPENTNAFTLYSLKSMLEGSMQTHYSWAHELQDRRKKYIHNLDDNVRKGVSFTSFANNTDFLQMLLPDMVLGYIKRKLAETPYTIADVMSGNYPDKWKEQICLSFKHDSGVRFDRLLNKSKNLLADKQQYWIDCNILFELLEDEGEFLHRCHQRVVSYETSHLGLALLTVFALVGSLHFQNHLCNNDGEVMRYFLIKR